MMNVSKSWIYKKINLGFKSGLNFGNLQFLKFDEDQANAYN